MAGNQPETTPSTTSADAQDPYYISPNGVDSSGCSGGTRGNPWKTWAKAESCVQPGDTVYFEAGTYSNIFSGSSRNNITFAGAPGQPIEIRPAPGAEGRVHFNKALHIYGEYGVLYGMDINASSAYIDTALSIHLGCTNIVIANNKIHDSKRHRCVNAFKNTDSISVINNEIYNCGVDPSNQTSMGVALETTGGTNIAFMGNHIHDAKGGIQIKGGALNVVVENNLIHDIVLKSGIFGSTVGACDDPNPQLGNSRMHDPSVPVEDRYQAKNVMVRNNIIYNNYAHSAISPAGWVDYRIFNNTVFNQTGSTVFYVTSASWEFFDSTALDYCDTHACGRCTGYSGDSLDCVSIELRSKDGQIRNNLVYGFDNVSIILPGNSTNLVMANNLYYTQGFTKNTSHACKINGTWYSLSQFQALGYEAGSLATNPKLMNATDTTNPDLRPTLVSPAIDHGAPLADVDEDFAGTTRPMGASHDIGAYEHFGFEVRFRSFLPQFTTTYSQLPPRP